MIKSIATAAVLGLTACQPAMAQPLDCNDSQSAWRNLNENYGETRQSVAIGRDGIVIVETWANPETGTFTILGTSTFGKSCVIMEGTDWASTAPVVGDPA